ARDTRRHLLDDAGLPLVRRREVQRRAVDLHAELRERLVALVEELRCLHPRLRGDAADTEAGAAELRLLLDARHLRSQLRRADRCGVARWATAEDGNIDFHLSSS